MKTYIIFALSALLYGCSVAPTTDAPPPDRGGYEKTGRMAGMPDMNHEHSMHNMEHGQGRHRQSDPFGGPYKSAGADCGGIILCPASSPHSGYHATLGEWNLMAHGGINLTYTLQPKPRGESGFAAPNHFMIMGDHALDGGTVRLNLGMSFDALTESKFGKPQLFQTGELYEGRENVDVQHRHPLITNLSVSYVHQLSKNSDWFCTVGIVGDVSGVPMEAHRASAKRLVDPSLFHHGTTDKHIATSVMSCGTDIGKIRMSASGFHGQEPGSNPYSLSPGAPDSFAVSFQYLPTVNWAFSLYYASIHNAERAEPGDIHRFTAAVMYTLPLEGDDWWTTTGIFTHDEKTNGSANIFVLDSTWKQGKNWFYGRIDMGQKEASLAGMNTFGYPGLDLSSSDTGIASDSDTKTFLVGAGTVGYARTLWENKPLEIGIGADITGYVLPQELREIYGSFPISANAYIFMRF